MPLYKSMLTGVSMSNESVENIVDLSAERTQRVHDLNEKRLQEVRGAFIKALPFAKVATKAKKKTKKKR